MLVPETGKTDLDNHLGRALKSHQFRAVGLIKYIWSVFMFIEVGRRQEKELIRRVHMTKLIDGPMIAPLTLSIPPPLCFLESMECKIQDPN